MDARKALITFHTQSWEWYGDDEFRIGRHKPKGGSSYTMEVDDGVIMYDEGEMVDWFKEFLKKRFAPGKHFYQEYLEHTVEFSHPVDITEDWALWGRTPSITKARELECRAASK